ncbi:MAG: sigma-54-dependent Fis family transcriptional regulator [Ignavibacteriales bacterium]|jgi:DNA-binding NtrC family response regulator|nr:sigma-54 dependent transcriptional regulator [Ignavibacteriaceae bacterium]NLH60708.1 sigma-54-dependent Fis family transcriptional regulator [Ignavibacteriales bacterium]HOJ19087.1 sigma-54 dependent transcriptional regulator [Ignavibacteriaceae bacterium]HPO55311.1 sigma-54 dependent transcriptional regulator [Ignavibacteriaceae bacterium]
MEKVRILIVDDENIVRESLFHWFEEEGYEVDVAEDGETALKKFEKGKYNLMLVDMKMPGMSGLDLLTRIKEIDDEVIFILITAFASVPTAIRALKDGAFDYITKPIDPEELSHIVDKALNQQSLKKENILLKTKIDEIIRPDNLVGESMQMKKIFSLINTVAPTDTTVMIRGESGTGKELIAKAIHINSNRKYFPIITVNCGALSESLLESELFGHEKGAFTGAQYKRKGKFEMANGGTIFLDEIGTVSPKMQIDLLRVLETKQFYRVGGNEMIKSDFRVIAATNENLETQLKNGLFREDLYYRLNVFSIFIPPLRERRDDIELLAQYFLKKFNTNMNKKISDFKRETMDFLVNYNWPGNVRELENAIERAVVVCKEDKVSAEDLPFHVGDVSVLDEGDKSLAALEKRHIIKILQENNWNISKSAEILGIDRVTLYNKLNRFGLKRDNS